jgi:hypothetical protein
MPYIENGPQQTVFWTESGIALCWLCLTEEMINLPEVCTHTSQHFPVEPASYFLQLFTPCANLKYKWALTNVGIHPQGKPVLPFCEQKRILNVNWLF